MESINLKNYLSSQALAFLDVIIICSYSIRILHC